MFIVRNILTLEKVHDISKYYEGVVNGSNGKLCLQNNATRAVVAAILIRFCEMKQANHQMPKQKHAVPVETACFVIRKRLLNKSQTCY